MGASSGNPLRRHSNDYLISCTRTSRLDIYDVTTKALVRLWWLVMPSPHPLCVLQPQMVSPLAGQWTHRHCYWVRSLYQGLLEASGPVFPQALGRSWDTQPRDRQLHIWECETRAANENRQTVRAFTTLYPAHFQLHKMVSTASRPRGIPLTVYDHDTHTKIQICYEVKCAILTLQKVHD